MTFVIPLWGAILIAAAVIFGILVVMSKFFQKATCFFGHHREYLDVRDRGRAECRHGYITISCCQGAQIARWACKNCPKMGEHVTPAGYYKIENAQLIPDKEGWAKGYGKRPHQQ
jgi:hypothetical protein